MDTGARGKQVRTWGEDDRLRTEERGLGDSQACQHLDLGSPASGRVRKCTSPLKLPVGGPSRRMRAP